MVVRIVAWAQADAFKPVLVVEGERGLVRDAALKCDELLTFSLRQVDRRDEEELGDAATAVAFAHRNRHDVRLVGEQPNAEDAGDELGALVRRRQFALILSSQKVAQLT